MPMPLEKWQERLKGHFASLSRARRGHGFPIFALEHGLSNDELEELSQLLRVRLRSRLSLSQYWLCCVIYTTEHGYGYTGDEYWRSFEEETPGWDISDRYKVTPWFRKFQENFDGVVPSGPWAGHFRIIAWPITHAILPRYLQREFARTLFDLRYKLAGLNKLIPVDVGRMFAANADHTTSRFQEFLQQEELTGRIVLGLLGQTASTTIDPIYPPTLERIVGELDAVRGARDWLKETQKIVADRFRGIGRGSGASLPVPRPDRKGVSGNDTSDLNLQPNLLLRYAGSETWSVILEVPSFTGVAALNADLGRFIQRTRCRLNGANDMKPAGWLLASNRKGILKAWPDQSKPLVQFERANPVIDTLLQGGCHLSSGQVWLFRISPGGIAREIVSRVVRPELSYILVATKRLPAAPIWASPCSLQCTGANAIKCELPRNVSGADAAWLHGLGIQVARTIRVWPAGLPGRKWDGEGSGEWLNTESPCFGIVHDYPVDAYEVSVDQDPVEVIEAGGVGTPAFVRLSPLPVGTHMLKVKARQKSSIDRIASSPSAEGFVRLIVREPEPWIPGVLSHSGLLVTLDPYDADLDTFWRNKVSVSVLGPESHSVTCTVMLKSRDGRAILSEDIAAPMSLPITPEVWSKQFARFVDRRDCAWRYLEASNGCLIIKGEALGTFSHQFEHDLAPLRWVLRRGDEKVILRLIDDTGQEGSPPQILFFSLERPLRGEAYAADIAFSQIAVPAPGGLFFAHQGEHRDIVVVSTGLSGEGLRGLGVKPNFAELHDGSVAPSNALAKLSLWQDARLAGFLVDIRHREIIAALLSAIYEKLCGRRWAEAELEFRRKPDSPRAIDKLSREVHRHAGFAAVLRRDFEKMSGNIAEGCRWYADLAARFGVCDVPALCTFALRIASQPHGLSVASHQLDHFLNEIIQNPTILRGARLLALLSANRDPAETLRLLPRWQWPSLK